MGEGGDSTVSRLVQWRGEGGGMCGLWACVGSGVGREGMHMGEGGGECRPQVCVGSREEGEGVHMGGREGECRLWVCAGSEEGREGGGECGLQACMGSGEGREGAQEREGKSTGPRYVQAVERKGRAHTWGGGRAQALGMCGQQRGRGGCTHGREGGEHRLQACVGSGEEGRVCTWEREGGGNTYTGAGVRESTDLRKGEHRQQGSTQGEQAQERAQA